MLGGQNSKPWPPTANAKRNGKNLKLKLLTTVLAPQHRSTGFLHTPRCSGLGSPSLVEGLSAVCDPVYEGHTSCQSQWGFKIQVSNTGQPQGKPGNTAVLPELCSTHPAPQRWTASSSCSVLWVYHNPHAVNKISHLALSSDSHICMIVFPCSRFNHQRPFLLLSVHSSIIECSCIAHLRSIHVAHLRSIHALNCWVCILKWCYGCRFRVSEREC